MRRKAGREEKSMKKEKKGKYQGSRRIREINEREELYAIYW